MDLGNSSPLDPTLPSSLTGNRRIEAFESVLLSELAANGGGGEDDDALRT